MAETTCPLRRSYGAGEGRAAAASDLPGPGPNPPRAAQAASAFPSTALPEGCACPPAALAMSKRLCNVTERETRILRSQPARPEGSEGAGSPARSRLVACPGNGSQPASRPPGPGSSFPGAVLSPEPWAVNRAEPCWAVLNRAEPCWPCPVPAPASPPRAHPGTARGLPAPRPPLSWAQNHRTASAGRDPHASASPTLISEQDVPKTLQWFWFSVALARAVPVQTRIGCCSWNRRGRQSTVAEISSAAGGKR